MAEVQKETRFAVVLYGGVSLAVYINGVCQELLRAVRGTHPDVTPRPGTSETVYRDLAAASGNRVVVDILSGTSAGGLNAAFLAKALAHDASLDRLTKLWAEEGDFLRLLGDDQAGQSLPSQLAATLGWTGDPPDTKPEARWWLWDRDAPDADRSEAPPLPPSLSSPKSLLSGDRFFLLLYEAVTAMTPAEPRELVESIHCYLTTTDLRGVPETLRLASGAEDELRHRSYFQFRHGEPAAIGEAHRDFNPRQNPVLAFAARATAAHPAAFHPAQWEQVLEFVPGGDDMHGRLDDHLLPYRGRASGHQSARWLSDGGDMDNKPFSYVLDPLSGRRASVPVDRRVLYVEPDPSSVDDATWRQRSLPGLGSYTVGAYALGRTETILQDIEAIQQRNAAVAAADDVFDGLVDRVDDAPNQIYLALWRRLHGSDDHAPTDPTESDWAALAAAVVQPDPDATQPSVSSWLDTDKDELVSDRGWGAWSFEQFRRHRVLDDLVTAAERVSTSASGVRPTWDPAAFRELVGRAADQWGAERGAGLPHRAFLAGFDLRYRLRRFNHLEHLLSKLQQRPGTTASDFQVMARLRDHFNELYLDIRTLGRSFSAGDYAASEPEDETQAMEHGLRGTRDHRYGTWRLNPLTGPLEAGETVGGVEPLVDVENPDALPDLAEVTSFLLQTHEVLEPWFAMTSLAARELIAGTRAPLDRNGEPLTVPPWLRMVLADAWGNYDDVDQLVLPLWDVAQGELDPIEVVRVSPRDARALIDERHGKRHKLGGNTLAHFGGFLDPDWRRNDILWGRLDAAEAIIANTVDPQDREQATRAAIDAILGEQVLDRPEDPSDPAPTLASVLKVNGLAATSSNPNPAHDAAAAAVDRLEELFAGEGSPDPSAVDAVRADIVDCFYRLLRSDPDDEGSWTVDTAATGDRRERKAKLFDRGARLFGNVLAHHAADPWAGDASEPARPTKGVAWIGRLLAYLVLAAVPVRGAWKIIRWLILPLATLAALAGVVGSFFYEWEAALVLVGALLVEVLVVVYLVRVRGTPTWYWPAIGHFLAFVAAVGAVALFDDWQAVLLGLVSWLALIVVGGLTLVLLPAIAGPMAVAGHGSDGRGAP